jgi:hypothetical protein
VVHEAIDARNLRELQLQPLSEHFPLIVQFHCNDFSVEQRRSIRHVMFHAAQRIEYALLALRDEWGPITRHFSRILPAPGVGGRAVEDRTWRLIEDNRNHFLNQLASIVRRLTDPLRSIYVRDYSHDVHPHGNPMATAYDIFDPSVAVSLRIRARYWALADGHDQLLSKTFWMIHEFGRYFLNLEDEPDAGPAAPDPESVQTFDRYVHWLANRHLELPRPPAP